MRTSSTIFYWADVLPVTHLAVSLKEAESTDCSKWLCLIPSSSTTRLQREKGFGPFMPALHCQYSAIVDEIAWISAYGIVLFSVVLPET